MMMTRNLVACLCGLVLAGAVRYSHAAGDSIAAEARPGASSLCAADTSSSFKGI